jgi:hypothetical protein
MQAEGELQAARCRAQELEQEVLQQVMAGDGRPHGVRWLHARDVARCSEGRTWASHPASYPEGYAHSQPKLPQSHAHTLAQAHKLHPLPLRGATGNGSR